MIFRKNLFTLWFVFSLFTLFIILAVVSKLSIFKLTDFRPQNENRSGNTVDKEGNKTALRSFDFLTETGAQKENTSESTVKREENKTALRTFIFLTETEQCLPSTLKRDLEIGNSSTCRCDVIVLSYKQECKEQKPPHITYLFDTTKSWPAGRNLLYFTAKKRSPGYVYYIFLNDDATFQFNNFAPPEMQQLSPIRVFQNWLLDYEPAVGVADHWHHGANYTLKKRRDLCGLNNPSLVLPVVRFDEAFDAFHHKAIDHLLPYDTRYDKISWWIPGFGILAAVETKFRGQALLFAPITVGNPKHRPYPRSHKDLMPAWRGYIEKFQSEAPAQYMNHSFFKKFKDDPPLQVETSRTYCMNTTRHQPITPFAHFALEN